MSDACNKDGMPGTVAFLVGAGRSGTTLLYKLLCLHAGIAFTSNYDNRLPWLPAGLLSRFVAERTELKLNTWFQHGGNAYFMKRPLVKKLFPTPVEGESIYSSCGIPLFPSRDFVLNEKTGECLRRRFERIRRSARADVMLSKRTANNRRIPLLDSLFPSARYIHLIRDGREVAHSLSRVDWWDDHKLWWDGRTPAQMERDGEERLKICARNWVCEMTEIEAGLSGIPKERILEIRYEKLLAEPVAQLRLMLEFLGLELTTDFQGAIESLHLGYRPGSWMKDWAPDQLEHVMCEEESLLASLEYL